MTQKEQVIKAMEENGGYATLQYLNHFVDVSSWGTKTPDATIRRIVQQSDVFFKIQPGLWALKEHKDEVLKKFSIVKNDMKSEALFTHSYYQGIVTEIGNMKNFSTYIPPQDKNKLFLEKKLCQIATTTGIYNFTYEKLLNKAKTVDIIWFNERKMPYAFYEIEHSTDIKNSLNKFYELQDFRAKFYIVAGIERKSKFEDIMSSSIYKPISELVRFVSYDDIIRQHAGMHNTNMVI